MVAAQVEILAGGAEPLAQAVFQDGEQRSQLLMNGDPELFVGLALHDGDQALVDVAPTDDEHVGHALTRIEGERCGLPQMRLAAFAEMLNGVPRPRRPAFADLELRDTQAGVVGSPAPQGAPAEKSREGPKKIVGIGGRCGARVAQRQYMLRLNAADKQVAPFGFDKLQVPRPFFLRARAMLPPLRAALVGGDESVESAGPGRRTRLAGCLAIRRPPLQIGRAVGALRGPGQLHPGTGALGAAKRMIAKILPAARGRAVHMHRQPQSTFTWPRHPSTPRDRDRQDREGHHF